jgi:hypothetical protein
MVQGDDSRTSQVREDQQQYPQCTWERRQPRVISSPLLLSLVNWMLRVDIFSWTLLYIPVVFYTMFCLLFLAKLGLELENEGRYDPVLYRDWRTHETAKNGKKKSPESDPNESLIARLPMPQYLCYVDEIDLSAVPQNERGVARRIEPDSTEDYIFVAYTREQFDTKNSHNDRLKLLEIGIDAAKKANVKAFWVDCYPVDEDYSEKEDIYRICDIVRSAHSLVIATNSTRYMTQVPGATADRVREARWDSRKEALKVWGNRAWTLPEVLLCSSQHKISVVDHSSLHRSTFSKHGLGYRALTDWAEASKLVDHYEGSVHLSQLELISIAYRCLRSRRIRGSHCSGNGKNASREYAYALMGLLRRRPKTVKTDSEFMAFARLSLSNNNESILERLLCMQPPNKGTQWHEITDAWGAQLWDIEPSCQIAAIDGISKRSSDDGPNTQTVVLDGVHGASICWSKLAPVPFIKRQTVTRRITLVLLPKMPFIFIVALFYLIIYALAYVSSLPSENASSQSPQQDPDTASLAFTIISSAIAASCFAFLLASPYLLKNLFYGKFWSTQARFYGIEGYYEIAKLEEQLFGINHGRLQWSSNTSLHSDTTLAEDGFNFEGKNPHIPDRLPKRDADGRFLFTLVDTYVMEVTAFYAERPPTVVMILGRGGGMQRAALCSYDWRTQSFCREVVLRMKTVVLNRMSRVDKFRFMLQKPGRYE